MSGYSHLVSTFGCAEQSMKELKEVRAHDLCKCRCKDSPFIVKRDYTDINR